MYMYIYIIIRKVQEIELNIHIIVWCVLVMLVMLVRGNTIENTLKKGTET